MVWGKEKENGKTMKGITTKVCMRKIEKTEGVSIDGLMAICISVISYKIFVRGKDRWSGLTGAVLKDNGEMVYQTAKVLISHIKGRSL